MGAAWLIIRVVFERAVFERFIADLLKNGKGEKPLSLTV
jgi:hypothetical protein